MSIDILVAVICLLALLGAPLCAALVWTARRRYEGLRLSPATDRLLRSPGTHTRRKLDHTVDGVSSYLIAMAVIPPLIGFGFLAARQYLESAVTLPIAAVVAIAILAVLGFCATKLLAAFKRVWRLQMGFEGEAAMGQELDMLMRDGAYVFHDFPADDFIIDHIVVSPAGVFAIETKSRWKPSGKTASVVGVDGETLEFPHGHDKTAIPQARTHAEWLAEWLSTATGSSIYVQPVLALPGWSIEYKTRSDVKVIVPKLKRELVDRGGRQALVAERIQQVRNQIEQRCRDAEAVAWRKAS